MATRTTVTLIDDIDGTPADESLEFAFEGTSYEIDLTTQNAERMREGLRQWVDAARRIGGRSTSRPKSDANPAGLNGTPRPVSRATNLATASARSHQAPQAKRKTAKLTKKDRDAMRIWARSQGYSVGKQGRISAEIHSAWEAAGRPVGE